MMRIKKAGYVVLCLFVCFLLCACQKNRGISEEQIKERIPEEFLMVDYEMLSYDSIEIEKRNTEKGVDDVYFDLSASHEGCEVKAKCHFVFNYYSQGGWILDYAEIYNGDYSILPLVGMSSDSAEADMEYAYSEYRLVDESFDSDEMNTTFIYDGLNEWEYYSQIVRVTYSYDLYSELEQSENPAVSFQNNISTTWSLDKTSYINEDQWVMIMGFDAQHYHRPSDHLVGVTFWPSESDESLLEYDGYKDEYGTITDSSYEGKGTTSYSVNYDDVNNPYLYFSFDVFYVKEDGTLSNDAREMKVQVYKDSIKIWDGDYWIDVNNEDVMT